jgi:multidrug resistance efflux pump
VKRIRSNTPIRETKLPQSWRNGRWSRRIYVLILAGIGLAVLNYAIGDAVILRADGMVVRNRYAVGATYPAKVAAVFVKEGDRVEEGKVLARLESAEILKDIAQLSLQYADISGRDTQIKVRSATNQDLMPLAERHAEQTAGAVRQYSTMKGLIPTSRQDQALGSEYMTASRLAELKNEARIMEQQLPLMEKAQTRAESALRQLDSFYDDGNIRAPVSGIVGAKIPAAGQVAPFGYTLFDVYGERSAVLAYLPEMYLFPLREGQKVEIAAAGRTRAIGTIEAILPVADALPPEFQNMFRPRDRGRLVRIALPPDTKFAVSEKIRVSGCAAGWCWTSDKSTGRSLASWVRSIILS